VLAAGLWWSYAGLVDQTADNRAANRLSSLTSDQLHSWKSERGEGEIRVRFSGDGRSFTYASLSGGWLRIWVKEALAGTEPYLVTSDETDNRMPIWSPDDQQIAFVSTRGNQTGIWSVPASGGEAVLLKALNDSNPQPIHWSKDGSTIYYQSAFNLYALDIASKETSQITDLKRSRLPRSFSISPGEGQIAYSDDKDGQVDLWFASLRGGDPVQVTRDPEEDRYPIWHPDGERILYTSNRGGVSEICVAYLDGRPPLQLTTGASGERRVSDISRDGTRMIEVTTRDDAEVYGVEVDTGREFDVPHEIGLNLWPDVSPDGKMIAFQYTSPVGRLVSSSVIARPLAGQGRVQLAFNGFNLRWSPDGSALAFLRVSGGTTDIFTVNAAGGDEKQLTSGGIYIGGYAILPSNKLVRDYCWSPDGTKIVYSTARSGYSNLWTINRDGAEDLQITSNSDANLVLYDPLYSPDGGRIAYISETRTKLEDGKKVWSLQLAEQRESRTVFQANSLIRLVGWSESGNELIVAVDKDNSGYRQFPIDVSVLVIDAGGSNREIGTFKSTYIVTTQLSPDGQTLSFVSDQDGADNIWAVPVTGGRARKITANADPKLYLANPVWSPDGKMIYYSKQTRWNVISAVQNFN
jgi:TolB protein